MHAESDDFQPDFRALAQIAEVFLQLVRALNDEGADDVTVDEVVALAAKCMPRGQTAAILLQEDGQLRTVAATSDVGAVIDEIRAHVGQGPSLDTIETNDVVVSGQLGEDPRWPDFGRRVTAETSVTSVATYRLYLGPRFRGALAFYSDWPYAFDDIAVTTGAVFAAYTSLALHHHFVLAGDVPYTRATSVHTEIGVAIGILMAGTGLDTQAAYQRLHRASRQLRSGLPETARRIVSKRSGGHRP